MISVIVPIYNAEKYLNKCLASIVNQTYRDLEIILVNDGSMDESLAICEKYKQADKRIVIVNKRNEGLVRARKDGIRIAKGEYITFVDADDWIDITTYEKVYAGKADIISYGLTEEYENYSKNKTDKIEPGLYDKKRIHDQIIPNMLSSAIFFEFGMLPNLVCKLIKKSLLLETIDNVSDNVTIGEDVDFFFRTVYRAESVLIKTDVLYHYRQHQKSMMRTKLPAERIKALYWDLYNIKEAAGLTEWVSQLNQYITFVMLLKRPESVVPYIMELSDVHGKVVIYGAGEFGKSLYDILIEYKNITRLSIVDKQWQNMNNPGYHIENPEIVRSDIPDKIIVAILNENVCGQVEKYLIEMGIDSKTIIRINFSGIHAERMIKKIY
jgi:glycosyltransferase involved in cell wall biosynthesis